MKIYLVFLLLFVIITDNEALGRTKNRVPPGPIPAHPSDGVPVTPPSAIFLSTEAPSKVKTFPWTMKKEPSIRVKAGRRIHKLPLESYVAGVIGNEMGKNWPREALKAQSVASRFFSFWPIIKKKGGGVDFMFV